MSIQNQTNCQAPQGAKAGKSKEVPTLLAQPVPHANGRVEFYAGNDRMTLQGAQVERVRELQEANDNLQRQVLKNERDIVHSSDPLAIVAEIEHCNVMISRNTGEILTIHAQNEMRLKRIAELEMLNHNIQIEMSKTQERFAQSNDMNERTAIASEFFFSKAQFEKNVQEIVELSKQ
ncbi:MAG: hypothetical protein JSS61_07110 [Verrucomicrobia bacterium]|nr:hypothetical protein [Verrucomicrobiota bacterium]